MVTYVIGAIAIYGVLYSAHPYGSTPIGEADVAFKTWFWTAFVLHAVWTLGFSALFARVSRTKTLHALVVAALVVAVLAIPTLGVLSFYNTCIDHSSYPFAGSSC